MAWSVGLLRNKKRISAAEIRILIRMCDKTSQDKIRNENIREK